MTLGIEVLLAVGINILAIGISWGTLWTRMGSHDTRLLNIEKKLGISSNGGKDTVVTRTECFLMESAVRDRLEKIEGRLTDIEHTLRGHEFS